MSRPPDQEDLDPLAQQFREFAYIVSHDLSAPLRAASTFSGILLREYHDRLDEKGREFLSLVATEASRAQAMLQGLLDYSRLNTMAKTVSTKVEAARVFEHCTIVLDDEMQKTGATFTAKDLPIIQADAEQFMQLLLYLFSNALKFIRPGEKPLIQFNGHEEDDHWHFTVRDNGIGIDARYRDKAFVLFRQLNPQGEYPGIGMGLTLSQKIVERHGGRIWLDDDGQPTGITVHFTIGKP